MNDSEPFSFVPDKLREEFEVVGFAPPQILRRCGWLRMTSLQKFVG